jgi:hypothetical protein
MKEPDRNALAMWDRLVQSTHKQRLSAHRIAIKGAQTESLGHHKASARREGNSVACGQRGMRQPKN